VLNIQETEREEGEGRGRESQRRGRNLNNIERWSDHIEGKGFLLLW